MDEAPPDQTIELDDDRFILIQFERAWPRYSAAWTVRRRSGDSDFPLTSGKVEVLPDRESPENPWESVAAGARAAATAAAAAWEEERPPRSFLERLLGRE